MHNNQWSVKQGENTISGGGWGSGPSNHGSSATLEYHRLQGILQWLHVSIWNGIGLDLFLVAQEQYD